MAKIRVLAVEDDELYADTLRMVMDKIGYDLIAIVSNPHEVSNMLRATQPDVLLMDIDLGGEITGIDLVKNMNESFDIPVVFLTSFKDKEVIAQAMSTQPEGYVTKPYDAGQLQAAIELAVLKQQAMESRRGVAANPSRVQAVFVKDGPVLSKLNLSEILLAEAYDKYCYVYTPGKKHLLSVQLKNLLAQLPHDEFIQVHRSYAVKLDAIEKLNPQCNSLEVAGKQVPVSKSFKQQLYSKVTTL